MTGRTRGVALLLSVAALSACGGGGTLPPQPPPPLLRIEVLGGWVCVEPEHCQDVYDVALEKGTELTVRVTEVTGPSMLRLAVYGPGVPLGGLNLLTNSTNDRRCSLANASDSVTLLAEDAGRYRIAVGRDWGFSSGDAGSYTLELISDLAMAPLGQTVDDLPTQATDAQCP
jgi:hypothetical protein